jgi:hypothetical protein
MADFPRLCIDRRQEPGIYVAGADGSIDMDRDPVQDGEFERRGAWWRD